MTNGKSDDGSSAPTRIREVKPANKAEGMREAPQPKPIAREIHPAESGASMATQIRGYAGNAPETMTMKDTGGAMNFDPVVGWLVVVEGPGRGKAVSIHAGMNSVGRSGNQRIALDFGDQGISGEGACFITFEPKRRTFHISHGGKANIVYLNDEAVLTPMPLSAGNTIAIADTKLRFVPLCGPDFNWEDMK